MFDRGAAPPLEEFEAFASEVVGLARGIEGYLTDREARFLALLVAYPTAEGVVLEIGSHKGKSTVILARAAAFAGGGRVVAVDPLTSPSPTDPGLRGAGSVRPEFEANLVFAGVRDRVEFHPMTSAELAARWDPGRTIRLLWIDGDHTYAGAKADFDAFAPFLSDGGIIAFHDVLHRFEGPIRVFAECVLASDAFGPVGLCGSIGWARYAPGRTVPERGRREKERLARRLRRLVPYQRPDRPPGALADLRYRWWRSRVPHGDVSPAHFLSRVRRSEA